MPYAVVIVERPEVAGEQSWIAFSNALSQLSWPDGEKPRLDDHVWLLDVSSSTDVLAGVVHLAGEHQIPHRVLYFDDPLSEYSSLAPLPSGPRKNRFEGRQTSQQIMSRPER